MEVDERIDDIVGYWFGGDDEARTTRWWKQDPAVDAEIRERFEGLYERAAAGELDDWERTPRGSLALIVLLDQMARNMFRGDPKMYAADDRALAIAERAVERGHDRELPLDQRWVVYMPTMHSEDLTAQERGIAWWEDLDAAHPGRFENNLAFARRHRDVVARFGRFPHRNAILGRESTAEEEAFLASDAAPF